MPLETPARIVQELTSRGYNADLEAVTLLASAPDPGAAVERTVESAPEDALKLSVGHVRSVLDAPSSTDTNPSASGGTSSIESIANGTDSPVETKGSMSRTLTEQSVDIVNDMTGASTGTGEYDDFVTVFRDRFQRLSGKLRGRVNARPTNAVASMPGGSDAAIVGMISDIRSTASGHWLVELEDTNGTFPCLIMKDKEFAGVVNELLLDETIAVEGTLSGDAGILFVDSLHFPDVPRTYRPSTADRHVQAALISDVHVGSQEFMADAWHRFTSWLHSEEAEHVEYLLICGDMVEGVGIYPNQDLSLIHI